MPDLPILTLLVFLPALGAVCIAFLPREEHGQQRSLALAFMLATLGVAGWAAAGFDAHPGAPEFQLQTSVPWVQSLGIGYHVGVDGFALVLVLLTALLGPIVVLSAFGAVRERVKEFLISLLILQTAMLGAFVSLDLVLFYVFWEVMLVPMYLLIGIWGSDKRLYAAVKFFIYTMAGSLLMLVAILYVYFAVAGPGGHSFDYVEILKAAPRIPEAAQLWLFLAFALSFAIKVPMVPLHTWLPDAHTEAPAAGSVVLAGVLLKMGGFGFLRYAFPLFPKGAMALRTPLAILAVVGILYGALMCLAQRDMKRLVAYSSVSHMGFVMLGLTAFTVEGLTGGVYQMLNHGVTTGALFVLVGILYERRHTRALADFGGIAKVVPGLAAAWLLVTLASMGLPGTNGFVGEFLILAGAWTSRLASAPWLASAAAVGVILGAVYMLWMYQRVFFGPVRHAPNRAIADLSGREWAVLAPLAALIVVMGVWPQPLLDVIEPSAARLVLRMGQSERGGQASVGQADVSQPGAVALPAAPRPNTGAPPPSNRPFPTIPPNVIRQLMRRRH
ncbi:MAG: NADH-quinone oxidoreductase subunit M [Deltaproteobacteria bacterium]